MIKKILLALAILIAIPLIAALFTNDNYHVEREIIIHQPIKEVFDYVVLLKNQNNYSKWAKMDPDMKKIYHGEDGQVGFISRWESNNPDVGIGEQEIKAIEPYQRIEFELRFIEPFQAVEPAYMTTSAIDEQTTKVTWGFSGHMKYPMNIMLWFVDFEQIIGDDLAQGLQDLKRILEQ
jgi:uncharacterized protein YndB with AHSA1/START domain